MTDKNTNTDANITAYQFGKEFAKGFWYQTSIMLIILTLGVLTASYFAPIDDCDIDRFNRCGMKVVTDAKTGKQYLLSPSGGIIERNN